MDLFTWLFTCDLLSNKVVNGSQCFPEFYDPFQQIAESEEEVAGIPDLQPVGQKCKPCPRTYDGVYVGAGLWAVP